MINQVTLLGNLGKDPQAGATDAGHLWARFSLATNRKWKDRDGASHEEVEWHQVVCWGRLAQIVSEYLAKGRQVYVQGRLKTSSWEDANTGQRRYRTEVLAERLQMLGGNGQGGPAPAPPPEVEEEAAAAAEEEPDDIPF